MSLFSRKAELKDSGFLTELSNQLGYETTNEKIQTRLSEILNNADNCIFVILDNENIIGWIHGFYSPRIESDSFIEIGGMVVDKNYRRKGVGQMLIKKVIEWSQLKKVSKIRVRCNTLRKETHIFYKQLALLTQKAKKHLT